MKYRKLLVAMALFIAVGMIVSAATLGYLSNKAQAKVKVDDPVCTLEYYDTASSTWKKFETGILDLGTIYGTDSAQWSYKVTKNAHSEAGNNDVQILGTLWGKLYCPGGIGLVDLTNITVYAECPALGYSEHFTWSNDADPSNDDFTPVDMGLWLKIEHETKILFSQWGYKGYVKLTFGQYATGDYSVEMQVL